MKGILIIGILLALIMCLTIINEWIFGNPVYTPPIPVIVLPFIIFPICIIVFFYLDIPEFHDTYIVYHKKHGFPPKERRIDVDDIKEVIEHSGYLKIETDDKKNYKFPIFKKDKEFCREYFNMKEIKYVGEQ